MSTQFYKLLSVLLDYPDDELFSHLAEISRLVKSSDDVAAAERQAILDFIGGLQQLGAIEAQARYVQTFDLTPDHSLHLTHHLFGDDYGRGPALVDLGEFYKQSGVEVTDGELPDYLPLILEYVCNLDEFAAQVFLGDAVKVLSVIADNLEKAHSPYAVLVRIVEARGGLAKLAATN
ncbi:MAG: hypothetical protein BMS9Abin26_2128 [Gammaproteobacteria bacterium]|nr:MAG: hypothetical protein BMS9Abin26_2128 [Gammaproteobacteria bacterium]